MISSRISIPSCQRSKPISPCRIIVPLQGERAGLARRQGGPSFQSKYYHGERASLARRQGGPLFQSRYYHGESPGPRVPARGSIVPIKILSWGESRPRAFGKGVLSSNQNIIRRCAGPARRKGRLYLPPALNHIIPPYS
jgi:hypothetical protein